MTYLSLSEKSLAIRYALLTINAAGVLSDMSSDKELTRQEMDVLKGAAQLIQEVIDGAMLVERKELKTSAFPTEDSLSAYGYALSTLQALNKITNIEGFTEYFEGLMDTMEHVMSGTADETAVKAMRDFFLVLSEAFREDIEKDRYVEPTNTIAGFGKTLTYASTLS